MSETSTRKEIQMFMRQYRKVVSLSLPKDRSMQEVFSKLVMNVDMYKELTVGLTIPKGHVALFEGIPIEPSKDMPYGAMYYIPKFLTVELSTVKMHQIN